MQPSTEQATSSEPASPLEVVEAFIAALEQLNLDAASALVAPNIRYQNVPLPPTKNKSQFDQQLRWLFGSLFRFEVQVETIEERAAGEVFTDRVDIAEGRGLFMRLPVRGTFRVENGLITEWVDRFSWPAFLAEVAKSAPSMIGTALRGLRR